MFVYINMYVWGGMYVCMHVCMCMYFVFFMYMCVCILCICVFAVWVCVREESRDRVA